MDYNEYWKEVRSIADGIAEEARSGDNGTGEDCREWLLEYLWETIDGHQFVIYTADSQDVIRHSPNDNYSAENFGAESIVDEDGHIKWEAIAFGALYADVMECLDRLSMPDGSDFDINDPNPEPDDEPEPESNTPALDAALERVRKQTDTAYHG